MSDPRNGLRRSRPGEEPGRERLHALPLHLPNERETKTLPIANRRARRANHLLRLFRRGEGRSHLNSRWARLPVTSKQERGNAAKQKPSLGNSQQDCNSRFASALGGSSLYPFQIQQDRPISEAVEDTCRRTK